MAKLQERYTKFVQEREQLRKEIVEYKKWLIPLQKRLLQVSKNIWTVKYQLSIQSK